MRHAITILAFLMLSTIVSATSAVRGPDGTLQINENGDKFYTVGCNERSLHITFLRSKSHADPFYAELAIRQVDTLKMLNISAELNKLFLSDDYGTEFKLSCFDNNNFIGMHIPHTSNPKQDLHLMIMDDGRVVDGYNLTAHGIK